MPNQHKVFQLWKINNMACQQEVSLTTPKYSTYSTYQTYDRCKNINECISARMMTIIEKGTSAINLSEVKTQKTSKQNLS